MARAIRVDLALVQRGYFPTRRQAQTAIMAGEILIDGRVAEKASDGVSEKAEISVAARTRYVSRGGIKLEGALGHFRIVCTDKVALDVGASTGGFTDCLLQHGARKIFAVDVGYGQMAWKIRQDPRVVVREKFNARHISPADFPEPVDICVIDVAFISLTLILPKALALLTSDGVMVALIKPQFELERKDVGRGGVVRSPGLLEKAQRKIALFSETIGAKVDGITPSSITGADGNQEFFICLRRL